MVVSVHESPRVTMARRKVRIAESRSAYGAHKTVELDNVNWSSSRSISSLSKQDNQRENAYRDGAGRDGDVVVCCLAFGRRAGRSLTTSP